MSAGLRPWLGVGVAVARRPRLWPEAARQSWRLGRPGGGPWLRFRMETAYGDVHRAPPPDDVVTWLDWSRKCVRPGRSTSN